MLQFITGVLAASVLFLIAERGHRFEAAATLREMRREAYTARIVWERRYKSAIENLESANSLGMQAFDQGPPGQVHLAEIQQEADRVRTSLNQLDEEGVSVEAAILLVGSTNANHWAIMSRKHLQDWSDVVVNQSQTFEERGPEYIKYKGASDQFLDFAQVDLGIERMRRPPWWLRVAYWWSIDRREHRSWNKQAWSQFLDMRKSRRVARRHHNAQGPKAT